MVGLASTLLRGRPVIETPMLDAAVAANRPAADPMRRLRRLVDAVQELSSAHDLNGVTGIVRRAARELGDADGATFILRDGNHCHYIDEDAIGPLWKGQRFPLSHCVSGWSILNRTGTAIPDLDQDPRVPLPAYRGTFVRSMAMVPIRVSDPIGAIGIYWARRHEATAEEMEVFQALANAAAVAMENVRILDDLERRVQSRTSALLLANKELEAFTHTISHDLRAPLRALVATTQLVMMRHGQDLAPEAREMMQRVSDGGLRLESLTTALLEFSAVARQPLSRATVPMGELARDVVADLRAAEPGRDVEVQVATDIPLCEADATLMRQVLANLLGNAFKATRGRAAAQVVVSGVRNGVESVYSIRDNGIGFEAGQAGDLFAPFKSLHNRAQFPGTGVGLSIVQRIVERHGGRAWAEGEAGRGATFYFSVPVKAAAAAV